MRIEAIGVTKPAAGVMATRPATAPEAAPSIVGLPCLSHSTSSQPRAAAAAAVLVLTNAIEASSLAPRAEPALKPNQPTHSSDAPDDGERQVVRRSSARARGRGACRGRWRSPGRRCRWRCGPRCRRRNPARRSGGDPAAAPDPVGQRGVDERRPEQHEQGERGEAHPLGERAGDQGRRDDRERRLVDHEQDLRDRRGQRRWRCPGCRPGRGSSGRR